MSPENPSSPPPLSPASVPPRRSKGRWVLGGCGVLLAFLLLIVATVAITIWWIQRPIKPVVLTPPEKAQVEEKLRRLDNEKTSANSTAPRSSNRDQASPGAGGAVEPGSSYVPGSKELKLTEREINGLLNANTDLGKSVRLEFSQDAINAYLAVRIPQDAQQCGYFRVHGHFDPQFRGARAFWPGPLHGYPP